VRRWPEAECLHQRVHDAYTVCNGHGEVLREVPDRCADCGKKNPFPTTLEEQP
jgi:hypothetical protein